MFVPCFAKNLKLSFAYFEMTPLENVPEAIVEGLD